MKLLLPFLVGILFHSSAVNAQENRDLPKLDLASNIDLRQAISLPAERSILSGSTFVSNKQGYTGNGFVDFGGIGSSASWNVDIPWSGSYDVTLRYASKSNRGPMHLLVDGEKVGAFTVAKVANNWDTWKEETINVQIGAGSNRVMKIFASVTLGPNVDKMEVKFTGSIPSPVQPPVPLPVQPPTNDSGYKIVLEENECLERGTFRDSESRQFEVGFDFGNNLVVRRKGSSQVLWSLQGPEDYSMSRICLKSDGSLAIEPIGGIQEPCDASHIDAFERDFRFRFGINNSGGIAVFLDSEQVLWTGGVGSAPIQAPIPTPTLTPVQAPVLIPTRPPTFAPTNAPTPMPSPGPTSRPLTPAPTPSDITYKEVLSQHNYFGRERGNFGLSESREFEVGLNNNGNLVIRRTGNGSGVVWMLTDGINGAVTGDRFYMQQDGNLVMRTEDRKAVWTSKSADNKRSGHALGINNCGGIAVFRTADPKVLIWTGGLACGELPPAPSPVHQPIAIPPPMPVFVPNPLPNGPDDKPYSVVLASGEQVLERERFVSSPNGRFKVGVNSAGQLILQRGNTKVWTLTDKYGDQVSNISRMYMQADGNLVLKTSSNKGLWNSETSKNYGSEFRIDDGGQLSVNFQGANLWMDGLPRNTYSGPSSPDLNFPLRGYFYYAWYPETWSVGGQPVKYTPNLKGIEPGQYRSGDPVVVKNHVKALDYGRADIGIISWWGPSDRLDRARITQLLDETAAQGSRMKWSVYYEDEKKFDRTVDELVADLDYLKKWFAWHPSWAHKDGKPIIFIWNESECEVADRWAEAAKKGGWYVVLKLFGDYDECKSQPDSWHQYGVNDHYLEYEPSFTIGPGFYKANANEPDHPRVPRKKFCQWVEDMNRARRDWSLIVSFNEWGEGTAVESAVEWESSSGYGIYLDCLHDPIAFGF